jgi:ribosomal protein L11 methyltransferase
VDGGDATALPTELPEWAVTQREHLEASVVGRFGVHPPWCEPVGRIQFSIDPGPTFGHGGHPSTVLVLAEIDRIEPKGLSVLDVGCGSGVLAIAAALLGADQVVAIDTDPDAISWTRYNADANNVDLHASTTPIAELEGPFDLVLANVLPSIHEELAQDLLRVTAGTLVLSGIPEDRADKVAGCYLAAGANTGEGTLVAEHRTKCEEWTAITLTKTPPGQ